MSAHIPIIRRICAVESKTDSRYMCKCAYISFMPHSKKTDELVVLIRDKEITWKIN